MRTFLVIVGTGLAALAMGCTFVAVAMSVH